MSADSCHSAPRAGTLLFYLLSNLQQRNSVVTLTSLSLSEWASVFGGTKMITAIHERLTLHRRISEPGHDSFRFKER